VGNVLCPPEAGFLDATSETGFPQYCSWLKVVMQIEYLTDFRRGAE